jgi:hypothetical protein
VLIKASRLLCVFPAKPRTGILAGVKALRAENGKFRCDTYVLQNGRVGKDAAREVKAREGVGKRQKASGLHLPKTD